MRTWIKTVAVGVIVTIAFSMSRPADDLSRLSTRQLREQIMTTGIEAADSAWPTRLWLCARQQRYAEELSRRQHEPLTIVAAGAHP